MGSARATCDRRTDFLKRGFFLEVQDDALAFFSVFFWSSFKGPSLSGLFSDQLQLFWTFNNLFLVHQRPPHGVGEDVEIGQFHHEPLAGVFH